MILHRTEDIILGYSNISNLLFEQAEREYSLLPPFLIRLSADSMRSLRGNCVNPHEFDMLNLKDEEADDEVVLSLDQEPSDFRYFPVEPKSSSCFVTAIDVSSMKVAESENGFVCAMRGAVVWRDSRSYTYTRCGPLVFHIGSMPIAQLAPSVSHEDLGSPSLMRALSRFRNLLERWIQYRVCSTLENGIVLFDGSLTCGTPDNPTRRLQLILDIAKERGNVVIAFSKATKLLLSGHNVTKLASHAKPPCLIDIDSSVIKQFPTHPIRLLGRIFVAKLAQRGFPFRVDIDRDVPLESEFESVGKLLSNDSVQQGYPETLRLAHILSTFTANEVTGIQRFLCKSYGFRMNPRLNMRRSLFGPFGTGMNALL